MSDSRDGFIDEVMTMLDDHEMLRPDVSYVVRDLFREELRVRLRMFQLRLPKLTKAQSKLNSRKSRVR